MICCQILRNEAVANWLLFDDDKQAGKQRQSSRIVLETILTHDNWRELGNLETRKGENDDEMVGFSVYWCVLVVQIVAFSAFLH